MNQMACAWCIILRLTLQGKHTGPVKTDMFVTASVTFSQLSFARCSSNSEAKFKLVTALTKQSTTNGNGIQLHAQDVTPLQVIVFLLEMHHSLDMSL
jgi:hypothetical protein